MTHERPTPAREPAPRVRTAVVTGAASGIGAAIARRLARAGWQVTGWDLAPPTPDADGVRGRTVDVADHRAVAAAADAVDGLDLLVNAAGIGGSGAAATLAPDRWDRVLAVDLNAVFYTSRALYRALSARRGLIVNIASITAHRAGRDRAAYCTAKAGVVMLTEVLGVEWAADGIRVVGVSPGYTRTPMVERALASGGLDEDRIRARTPQGRLLEADEVAAFVHALTGDTFAAVTATTLPFDGGWTANGDY
ncbi:SDR family NAD(P)-dependent oxidoreductase [Embleya hyalina]|uniref:Oxidoreductase n=1 Tax=Embleya hyalina TaxID=516124 RepID=A0A401Z1N8_9ACTN|nr:SDR family oxidoreductase [Embleya hyalina]GCE00757.1 oxidoreductase [Embleya hyalina]